MEGIMRWCWMALLLLGVLHLNIISSIVIDGKSDLHLYSLCNANKFSNGSDYESNYEKLLPSLLKAAAPSNVDRVLPCLVKAAAPRGGFATYSYAQVSGILQCRGDVSQHECLKCSVAASQMAHRECSNGIGDPIQLEFCLLRYERYQFAFVLDTDVVFALVTQEQCCYPWFSSSESFNLTSQLTHEDSGGQSCR